MTGLIRATADSPTSNPDSFFWSPASIEPNIWPHAHECTADLTMSFLAVKVNYVGSGI